MPARFSFVLGLLALGLAAGPAAGHFNMLLPASASARRGEPVTVLYQWGHPYEHQLFDAPAPRSLTVFGPEGRPTDLLSGLIRTMRPAAGKMSVTAYEVRFTPDRRGDFQFVLTTPPIWLEEEQEFIQDTVTAVLHVQAQKGWDIDRGLPLEVLPLTRPYGLQPGMAFQAQVRADGKPLGGALVEVEQYHPAEPPRLPPDEHITRTVRTDPGGSAVVTLTEPGWWCLTAQRDGGRREHGGKRFPLRQRATLWVFVDGAIRYRATK